VLFRSLDSNKEVSDFLFKDKGLKPIKSTATGHSVDMSVLGHYKDLEYVRDIMSYRTRRHTASAIRSFFDTCNRGVANPKMHVATCPTGRVHTSEPDIHHLVMEAREAIYPREGFVFVSADYKQQEARILAAITDCSVLLEAFDRGVDPYNLLASKALNKSYDEVTEEDRNIFKLVQLAVSYGQTPSAMAHNHSISVHEAKMRIAKFNQILPELERFKVGVVKELNRDGFVENWNGRKWWIPEIYSSVASDQSKAIRQAVNFKCQSVGADILKSKVKDIHPLKDSKLWYIVATFHDNIVFEIPEHTLTEEFEAEIREKMEFKFMDKVWLKVAFKYGKTLREVTE
jgi:DNA polymerase-1